MKVTFTTPDGQVHEAEPVLERADVYVPCPNCSSHTVSGIRQVEGPDTLKAEAYCVRCHNYRGVLRTQRPQRETP